MVAHLVVLLRSVPPRAQLQPLLTALLQASVHLLQFRKQALARLLQLLLPGLYRSMRRKGASEKQVWARIVYA